MIASKSNKELSCFLFASSIGLLFGYKKYTAIKHINRELKRYEKFSGCKFNLQDKINIYTSDNPFKNFVYNDYPKIENYIIKYDKSNIIYFDFLHNEYTLNINYVKNIIYGLEKPTYDDYETYKDHKYNSTENHHKLMWIFINKLDIKDKNYNGLNYEKISYKFCEELDILSKEYTIKLYTTPTWSGEWDMYYDKEIEEYNNLKKKYNYGNEIYLQ